MRDYIEILLKNNKIHKQRIRNPAKEFDVKIKIDDKEEKTKYFFRRNKSFERKGLLFSHRVSFYEYGNPEPLDPRFKEQDIDMKQIQALLDNNLIKDLGASINQKDVMAGMTAGAILGLAGIIGIVIIVLIG